MMKRRSRCCIFEEHIRGVVDHLAQDYSGVKIDHHVAIGAEIQSVAPRLGKARQGAHRVTEDELSRLTDKLAPEPRPARA
jgi:exopolyphosphatase/guanosine-5'-triphosphate,3'-diphosphate pyrophosphatase